MSRRFKLYRPVLTIGVSIKEGPVYKPYPSLSSALIHCALNEIPIHRVYFVLREIVPTEEHIISNPGNELYTDVAYIGTSPTPVLPGIDFKFANQYPHPNYSLPPGQEDHTWLAFGDSKIDWCKLIINAKVPYRYQVLQRALSEIAHLDGVRPILLRIINEIEKNWPSYTIKKIECMHTGVHSFEVSYAVRA